MIEVKKTDRWDGNILLKDINLQIWVAQQTWERINTYKTTARHNTFKLLKIKEKGKILESSKSKISFYTEWAMIHISTSFVFWTMEDRRWPCNIFGVLKSKTSTPSHTQEIFFNNECSKRNFLFQKLQESDSSMNELKEMLNKFV